MKLTLVDQIERIQAFIRIEYSLILWVSWIAGLVFYKLYLKQISEKRHDSQKIRFRNTAVFLLAGTVLIVLDWILETYSGFEFLNASFATKAYSLFLVVTLTLMTIAFIRLAQIYAYLYLFFMNMKVGVPRLLANIFTFGFSLIVLIYLLSEIFSVNLPTMIATSAVFSIVLGLALQDTLGNLFSGVAIQIGNPFSIGDWVEIQNGSNRWTGQIQEITWRATFILTFSNEWIMLPNKVVAQSQILIYSNNVKAVRHSQTFRFDYGVDTEHIKELLQGIMMKIPDLVADPAPRALITETAESWVTIKVFYSVEDFSRKYSIGDRVMTEILATLKQERISLATPKITYLTNGSEKTPEPVC